MEYQSAREILDKWETEESREKAREIKEIRADIATARDVLADGLARYRKKKLKARSKKKAAEDPFADLADYRSEDDIHDAYGWDGITEARKDYLLNLWQLREASRSQANDGQYHDRVTEILESALATIGSRYADQLFTYDQKQRAKEQEAQEIARQNNERTWRREHGEPV
jgi:hypothetical protein